MNSAHISELLAQCHVYTNVTKHNDISDVTKLKVTTLVCDSVLIVRSSK